VAYVISDQCSTAIRWLSTSPSERASHSDRHRERCCTCHVARACHA
jgi:hypothetical protein